MNFQPIISELILPDDELIIILRDHEISLAWSTLMLDFHMQDQNEEITLEDELVAYQTLFLSLLKLCQFVLYD